MNRWLYQGLAQPPPAAVLPAETVTVDKWFRGAVGPVRRRPWTPLDATVQPIDPSLYPIPGDGAWIAPISQPLPRGPTPPITSGAFVDDPSWVVETITLDKWFRPVVDPVFQVARSIIPAITEPPEIVIAGGNRRRRMLLGS